MKSITAALLLSIATLVTGSTLTYVHTHLPLSALTFNLKVDCEFIRLHLMSFASEVGMGDVPWAMDNALRWIMNNGSTRLGGRNIGSNRAKAPFTYSRNSRL